jgi:hypothetical protein
MRNWYVSLLLLLPCAGVAQTSARTNVALNRALPGSYLNNAAGALRSNVRWSWYGEGFIGDDFAIGAPGERWVVDKIRTWTVPGTAETDPANLGDVYQDVRLYFGDSGADLTPLISGRFVEGTSETSNSAIAIADASTQGTLPYDEFGRTLHVWQIDFNTASLVVEGGVKYRFGVWGLGRPDTHQKDGIYPWFNLASNASLSGGASERGGASESSAASDSADGVLLKFNPAGQFQGSFDSNGAGWDKSSDINIEVFAHKLAAR